MAFRYQNRTINDSDDEQDNEVCFGMYRGDIVGIRYYRGTVNNKEMVSLGREPQNPYDRNAVRVDNVSGVQVGHIKREQARALADVVDHKLARLEGVVPYGQKNIYQMPCDVSFWGKPENEDEVIQRMRRYGYSLRSTRHPTPTPTKGASWSMPSLYGMGVASPPAIRISQEKMRGELDKLFEKLSEKDKTATLEPAQAIKSKLFPHQKQALAWMTERENSPDLPPFWVERLRNSKTEYFNTATNYAASKRPESVRGGILADDMGLGKTLEIIALIVSNFHNGNPLVTLEDVKPAHMTVNKRKKKLRRTVHKKERKRPMKNFIKDDVEMSDDEPLEVDAKEMCDETSDEEEGDSVLPLGLMTGKEDPDYNPVSSQIPASSQSSEPTRRSSRVKRKPVKYVDVDSDDEGFGTNSQEVVPSPVKKPRTKKKPTAKTRRDASVSAVVIVEDDTPLPSLPQFDAVVPGSGKKAEDSKEKNETVSHRPVRNISSTAMETPSQPEPVQFLRSPGTRKRWCAGQGARPTLVVCPLSVLSNWEDQIEEHIHSNLLDVYTYYGSDRKKDKNFLEEQDIVITTYQTLSSEYSKGNSPLQKTNWLRVVLDEGHIIRNPSAQMSKAAHALKAERRWVVTGTPIQNSMKDLWSVICFLQLEPFTDRQWWRRTMERPVSEGDKAALGRVQSLMGSIAMRRTKHQKVDGRLLVELPQRQVFVQHIELSAEERQLYDSVASQGKVVIGKYFKSGSLLSNYADVLAILMRLRQLCCHPKLCASALAMSTLGSDATPDELREKLVGSLKLILSSGIDEECAVCLDSLNCPVITHCAHVFCRRCIEDVIWTTEGNSRCPLCRNSIRIEQLVDVPDESEAGDVVDSNEWHSSAKVDALMSALVKQRSEDPSLKSIVVSQFTSMLTILETPLQDEGFRFVRLDGSMTQRRRAEVISEFSDPGPGSPTVFLLSLKAGGVGLNLVAASRLFLVDPAWNPAAEEQCFDRCHRLGQTRDVVITKFVVKNSVEERMLDLQKKKQELMAGAFKKLSAEQRRQQRMDGLKSLIDL